MNKPEIIEQLATSQQATAEMMITITRMSFEGMQRIAELNKSTAQAGFSSTADLSSTLASSKDMSDLGRVREQMMKPEGMIEYWRKLHDLVSTMQKDVTKVMQANQQQFSKTAMASLGKSKMAGSDVMANTLKNMLDQTTKAVESITTVASQMANIASANSKQGGAAAEKMTGSVTDIASKK